MKQLSLNRETLAALDTRELDQVAGGYPTAAYNCTTDPRYTKILSCKYSAGAC